MAADELPPADAAHLHRLLGDRQILRAQTDDSPTSVSAATIDYRLQLGPGAVQLVDVQRIRTGRLVRRRLQL